MTERCERTGGGLGRSGVVNIPLIFIPPLTCRWEHTGPGKHRLPHGFLQVALPHVLLFVPVDYF